MSESPFIFNDETLKKLHELETSEYQGKCVRVYIEGKHCDGFTYGLSFDDFDSKQDNKWVVSDKISFIVDKPSIDFLQGCEIKWNDNELGKGFLITNPKQKEFRGKFYKREKWVKKLTKSDT